MKTIITSYWRPLCRVLCAVVAALCVPSVVRAQVYYSEEGNNFGTSTVGEYNATTGAVINASFITGVVPAGLALSGNDLFVADPGNGTVGEYNATTGALINASFLTGQGAVDALLVSGNTLFTANSSLGGSVGEYNATTGAVINANFISVPSGSQGLATPSKCRGRFTQKYYGVKH